MQRQSWPRSNSLQPSCLLPSPCAIVRIVAVSINHKKHEDPPFEGAARPVCSRRMLEGQARRVGWAELDHGTVDPVAGQVGRDFLDTFLGALVAVYGGVAPRPSSQHQLGPCRASSGAPTAWSRAKVLLEGHQGRTRSSSSRRIDRDFDEITVRIVAVDRGHWSECANLLHRAHGNFHAAGVQVLHNVINRSAGNEAEV